MNMLPIDMPEPPKPPETRIIKDPDFLPVHNPIPFIAGWIIVAIGVAFYAS